MRLKRNEMNMGYVTIKINGPLKTRLERYMIKHKVFNKSGAIRELMKKSLELEGIN